MCNWKYLAVPFSFTLTAAGTIFVLAMQGCESSLQYPITVVAGVLFAVSLVALLFVCSRNPVVIWIYLSVMLLLVALLLFFVVFAFKKVDRDVLQSGGDDDYGSRDKEFRIEDYSRWLRKKVDTPDEWNRIRRCVVDIKICGRRSNDPSPMRSGCCKPPSECGFFHRGATVWDKPATGLINSSNADCAAWGNDKDVLCYDCQSCKAAVLALSKRRWVLVACLSMVVLSFYAAVLLCVFASLCRAVRERKTVHVPDHWNDNALPVQAAHF